MFFLLIAGHAGDLPLFTWYNWMQVENLCIVHLHLHGFFVQHSNIIPKQTSNHHGYSSHPEQQVVTVTAVCQNHLLAKVVAFQGTCPKITSNIGQSR